MLSSVRITTLYLLLFLPLTSTAQTADQAHAIQNIVAETSIKEQIVETTSQVKDEIKSNPLNLSRHKIDQMIDEFDQVFASDTLMQQIQSTFDKEYDQKAAEAAIQWIEEPATQKVLDEKSRFYTLQGTRERIVRRYELEQDPLDQEHKDLLQSLIKATSAEEASLKSQTIIFRSILSAFNSLSNRNLSPTQIDGIVQNYREQMQAQTDREVTEEASIMFYAVDAERLSDYLSFYQSEAGRWLSSTTNEAKHSALQSAADRFNKAVAEIE